jgi:hypothetical protein
MWEINDAKTRGRQDARYIIFTGMKGWKEWELASLEFHVPCSKFHVQYQTSNFKPKTGFIPFIPDYPCTRVNSQSSLGRTYHEVFIFGWTIFTSI